MRRPEAKSRYTSFSTVACQEANRSRTASGRRLFRPFGLISASSHSRTVGRWREARTRKLSNFSPPPEIAAGFPACSGEISMARTSVLHREARCARTFRGYDERATIVVVIRSVASGNVSLLATWGRRRGPPRRHNRGYGEELPPGKVSAKIL